jgi:nitrogen fixation NifU-like protein
MSNLSNLRELYQEVIIDHNKNPRHFYEITEHTHHAKGFNPLCGDKLELYLVVKDETIQDVGFKGSGCAISTASASLMTEVLINKSINEAEKIFQSFHALVTQKDFVPNEVADLGKLSVLKGVQEFPSRIKCATLAWHTLHAALKQQDKTISTEE